jgi:large subunit ribosomal protein L17
MRHGKKFNHLSRKPAHRKAMLSNMACSLIEHKRINTTVAKAKALRQYVEPLLTKSKTDSTHSRRTVFKYLQSKEAVTHLFRDVAPKIGERPGGYTRIIRTGNRLGDNAEMCMIELVDFNELMLNADKPAKKTTRRSRRGGGAKTTEAKAETVETKESTDSKEETKAADAPKEKAEAKKAEAKAEKPEEKKAEAKAEKKEEKAAEPKKEKKAEPKAKKEEAPKKEEKKDDADQKENDGENAEEKK